MRPFRLLLLLLLLWPLSACSYFAGEEDIALEKPVEIERFDLMRRESPPGDGLPPMRMEDISAGLSDGSVEIYGFEDLSAPSSLVEQEYARLMAEGPLRHPEGFDSVVSRDSSVEIFPLDGPVVSPVLQSPRAPFDDLAPIGAPEPALPKPKPDYVAIRPEGRDVARVFFGHNGTALRTADLQVLEGIARHFKAGGAVEVIGHASVRANIPDSTQRKIVNLKVSLDRAFEVTKALILQGVPAEAIKTSAWGETRPAVSKDNPESESVNRRVEIFTDSLQ